MEACIAVRQPEASAPRGVFHRMKPANRAELLNQVEIIRMRLQLGKRHIVRVMVSPCVSSITAPLAVSWCGSGIGTPEKDRLIDLDRVDVEIIGDVWLRNQDGTGKYHDHCHPSAYP
jgi:hypothetical protein